jgi:hypothetical protein
MSLIVNGMSVVALDLRLAFAVMNRILPSSALLNASNFGSASRFRSDAHS